MNATRKLIALAAVLVTSSGLCFAQSSSPASTSSSSTTNTTTSESSSPYVEGSVWQITMLRTKPGMNDEFLRGWAKTFKAALEEQKKQGLVVSYKILLGSASTPEDYNLMNMVEYKNMAALDNLRDKTDPIFAKIVGGEQQRREGAMKRNELRDVVGNKLMREITLK